MLKVNRFHCASQDIPIMRTRWIFSGFPGDLEREFSGESLRIGIKYIRFASAVAGIITILFAFFNLFLPLDGSGRSSLTTLSAAHLFICIGIAIAFFLSTFSKNYLRFAYPCIYTYFFLFGLDVCLWLGVTSPGAPVYLASYAIFAFFCVGFYVGTHIRFIYAIASGMVMTGMYSISILCFNHLFESDQVTGFSYGMFYFLFFIGANIFGIIGSFFYEYFRRHYFLLRKRIRVEEAAARRRAFDEWKAAYLKFHEFNGRARQPKKNPGRPTASAVKTPAAADLEQVNNDSLAELLDTFGQGDGYGRVYDRIMDFVLKISGSRRGAIAIRDDRSGQPVYIVRHGMVRRDTALVSGILEETFSSGKPIIVNLARDQGGAVHREAARENGVRSLLCFPVELQGTAIGACYLDKGWSDDEFSGESDELIISLVTQAVLSVNNAAGRDEEPPAAIDMDIFNAQCEKLRFTARERQLALLVARGFSKRKICSKLFISVNTLRTHLKNINGKAAVAKRSELLRVLRGGKPVSREQEILVT